ncbi:hypothetical protein [Neobacillus drentensis]|uniref:hypothetical protein n=1 Tax=Neobacillus drentensis TaxID=220684 RepID=UPI002FFD7B4A
MAFLQHISVATAHTIASLNLGLWLEHILVGLIVTGAGYAHMHQNLGILILFMIVNY